MVSQDEEAVKTTRNLKNFQVIPTDRVMLGDIAVGVLTIFSDRVASMTVTLSEEEDATYEAALTYLASEFRRGPSLTEVYTTTTEVEVTE